SGQLEGRAVVLAGGADGFIAAYDLNTGQPLKRAYLGAPVVGLAQTADDGLLVATRAGITVLKADWQTAAHNAVPAQKMLPLDHARVLIVRDDQTLEVLSLAGAVES
ncbi:MAG TPA: hypothetical protein PKX07_03295, partial [Aggregatilineales bacterium]|nr:hypothetical protein [Aggregatilineales bacterium]